MTLTLTGDEFAATVLASQVSVKGIDGVGVASVTRDSGTQLSVTLAFDGTDFDVDGELAFTVAAAAITGSTTDLSTAGLAVTAVVEAAPLLAAGSLTEDNLDGAVVTLTLTGDEFAATVLASQVSVKGIDGVGVASVTRDSGTQLSVTLAFDGTDFRCRRGAGVHGGGGGDNRFDDGPVDGRVGGDGRGRGSAAAGGGVADRGQP